MTLAISTPIGRIADPVERFFAFARERHAITLRRAAGSPRPWTDDPILQKYRFCSVFRELDRTTIWFREHVRDPLRADPNVLLATVLFRWFNRISTGETLFSQPDLLTGMTPWEAFLAAEPRPMRSRISILRAALRKQGPPWVTGSYTINSRGAGDGLDKLDGVLALFGTFAKRPWYQYAVGLLKNRTSLEEVWGWLQEDCQGLGGFMAYEIVSDLRWTDMLRDSADIKTWANPGPGAKRGLWRIGGDTESNAVRRPYLDKDALVAMRELFTVSWQEKFWPLDWPRWEMREVEHTLCEFDKYERTRLGQGRPRGVFA